jgi:hypothetical protein
LISLWSGKLAFQALVLWYFRFREFEGERIVANLHCEVPKGEKMKVDGGIALGHKTGSSGQDPSGDLVTR